MALTEKVFVGFNGTRSSLRQMPEYHTFATRTVDELITALYSKGIIVDETKSSAKVGEDLHDTLLTDNPDAGNVRQYVLVGDDWRITLSAVNEQSKALNSMHGEMVMSGQYTAKEGIEAVIEYAADQNADTLNRLHEIRDMIRGFYSQNVPKYFHAEKKDWQKSSYIRD